MPEFKEHFAQITPLILAEWPQVSPAELEATEGEYERVVDCVVAQTERTRTLTRRQLQELRALALAEPQTLRASPQKAPPSESNIDQLLRSLEARTEDLLGEFKQEMLPELEQKARNNLGSSLLVALGIGFILGLLLGGKRG